MPTVAPTADIIKSYKGLLSALTSVNMHRSDEFFAEWTSKNYSQRVADEILKLGRDDRSFLEADEDEKSLGYREQIRLHKELPVTVEKVIEHMVLTQKLINSEDMKFIKGHIDRASLGGLTTACDLLAKIDVKATDSVVKLSHLELKDLCYTRLMKVLCRKTGSDIDDVEGCFENLQMKSPTKVLVDLRAVEYAATEQLVADVEALKAKYPKLVGGLQPLIDSAKLKSGDRANQREIVAARTQEDWKSIFCNLSIMMDRMESAITRCLEKLFSIQNGTVKDVVEKVLPLFPVEEKSPTSTLNRIRRDLERLARTHEVSMQPGSFAPCLKTFIERSKRIWTSSFDSMVSKVEEAFSGNGTGVSGVVKEEIEKFKGELNGVAGRPARVYYGYATLLSMLASSDSAVSLKGRVDQRFPAGISLDYNASGTLCEGVILAFATKEDRNAMQNIINDGYSASQYQNLHAHHALRDVFSCIEDKLTRIRDPNAAAAAQPAAPAANPPAIMNEPAAPAPAPVEDNAVRQPADAAPQGNAPAPAA